MAYTDDNFFYCEEVIETCIEFESDHAYCRFETDCEAPIAGSSGLGTGLRGPANMQSPLDEFLVKSNFKKE